MPGNPGSVSDGTITQIVVQDHPIAVSLSPDGSTQYVSNWDSNSISMITSAANNVVDVIPGGSNPRRSSITRKGRR